MKQILISFKKIRFFLLLPFPQHGSLSCGPGDESRIPGRIPGMIPGTGVTLGDAGGLQQH